MMCQEILERNFYYAKAQIKLENELKKELEEIALENNRNLKQEIEIAIKHYIKEYKKKNP